MTVGLIGYGRFGRLLAAHLARDVRIVVHDPALTPRSALPRRIVRAPLPIVASRRIVILAVPVRALRGVVRSIAPFVRPRALVIDVCAVKSHPARWMKRHLPHTCSILGTHPLFGPDSAARTVRGRTVVLCPVRISPRRLRDVRRALGRKGVISRVMNVGAHDRIAAETILLTQYLGRLVAHAGFRRHPALTANYGRLLAMVDSAGNDSLELFVDMVRFNPRGRAMVNSLQKAQKRVFAEVSRRKEG